MDYETLEQAMNSPYLVPTAIAAATGIAGLLIGYVSGKITGGNKVKLAQFQRDVEIARAETQKISYETDRQKILSELEIKRLSFENAEEEHKRNLEKMSLQRQYQLEDEDRQRKSEQEKLKAQGEYRLQIAEKLSGLKPVVEAYLQQLGELQQRQPILETESINPEYEEQRQNYRISLIEKWEEQLSDNDDDILNEDIAIPFQRTNELVEFKYPNKRTASQQLPKMPEELAGLIRILNQ